MYTSLGEEKAREKVIIVRGNEKKEIELQDGSKKWHLKNQGCILKWSISIWF